MRGDYHRYLAEISGVAEDKENSLTAYKAANDIASQELKATDPTEEWTQITLILRHLLDVMIVTSAFYATRPCFEFFSVLL